MNDKAQEDHLVLILDSGDELSIRRFRVHEELSGLFSVRLIATASKPDIDLEKIVGHAAAFQLRSGLYWVKAEVRLWTGICEHAEQLQGVKEGEASTYYLHIVPALWLTTQRRETRIFQHQTIPDIIRDVLREWGIQHRRELKREYKKHEYIVQYGETDYDFLCRLMEWAGITFYFKYPTDYREQKKKEQKESREAEKKEAEKKGGSPRAKPKNAKPGAWTDENEASEEDEKDDAAAAKRPPAKAEPLVLILADQIEKNPPRPGLPIHYVDQPNRSSQEEYATQVKLAYHVRPGRVTLRDFDFRRGLDYKLFAKEEKSAPAPEDFYEQYHYVPGGFRVEGSPARALPVADSPLAYTHDQEGQGKQRANRELASARRRVQTVKFVSNCLDLAPGVIFAINHYPHDDLPETKNLLVTRFSLEGEVNKEWTYEGEAVFAELEYQPEQRTPKPRIHGVQSAIVVGLRGEKGENPEIYVDELGRIKVQFHWDRDGKYDEKSSCWVRVSQEWAGTGFGSMLLPRVGQEVLVAFLEGDPDHPVVVGRVYNNLTNKVPYPLPEHKTRSTWKSDSSPTADGFNEIMFEDEKKEELVYLQAEKDLQKLVKQFETDRVGEDHMTVVGENRSAVVSKLDATMVGGRYLLRTIKPPSKDDLQILPQKAPDIDIRKTFVEVLEKRVLFTTGKASVLFDDTNIRFEAAGKIIVIANGDDCIIESKRVDLNPGSPPKPIQQPKKFDLPKHGDHKGEKADERKKLKQQMERAKIGQIDLDAPLPPPPGESEQEQKVCELLASLVHCQHPTALRQPCVDKESSDYHVLEVVPAEDLGKEGRLKEAMAVDTINLKSKLRGGCGKHTVWRITKPDGGEELIGESQSFQIKGWYRYPALKEGLSSEDLYGYDSVTRKGTEKGIMHPGADDKTPLKPWHGDWDVKGWWTGNVSPRAHQITAAACQGRSHSYRVDAYPSDVLSVTVDFNAFPPPPDSGLWLYEAAGGWFKNLTELLEAKSVYLNVELKLVIKMEAKWAEYEKDHRAFYQYSLSLGGAFEAGVGYTFPVLSSLLTGGVASGFGWLIGEFDPLAFVVAIEGSATGMMTWKRDTPDSRDIGGKVEVAVKPSATVRIHLLSRRIASARAELSTEGKLEIEPTDSGQLSPELKYKLSWTPCTILFEAMVVGKVVWEKKKQMSPVEREGTSSMVPRFLRP
jgi:type VI secretion system secreted protein VgrG